LPIVSRQIQMSGNPLKIASTLTKSGEGFGGPERFSILGDIINVFVKEYKEWRNKNGIQR
jgi:hypothetical protein